MGKADKALAKTPAPPYVAVIFTSQRTQTNEAAYHHMAEEMDHLATAQPGYLGLESARDIDGFGITVSYWRDEESARAWKQNIAHLKAQEAGRNAWYDNYHVRIAHVVRDYAKVSD